MIFTLKNYLLIFMKIDTGYYLKQRNRDNLND